MWFLEDNNLERDKTWHTSFRMDKISKPNFMNAIKSTWPNFGNLYNTYINRAIPN